MANERETDREDSGLAALFAEARDDGPSDALKARVVADALAEQTVRVRAPAVPRRGWLAELVDAVGGWRAASGIMAAGVAGLAVGLYAPDSVTGLLGEGALSLTVSGYDLTPDIGELWTENGDV